PGPARQLPAAEEAAAKTDPVEEEEDWLIAALARKKAQAQAKAQERTAKPSEVPAAKTDPVEEEEDWLIAALARKKAQAQAKAQERTAKPSEVPGEGLHPRSPVRRLGAPAAQPHEDATGCQAALLRAQARVAELESQ
ncbi:unnamed protein product, partial [Bubo scandiacus]